MTHSQSPDSQHAQGLTSIESEVERKLRASEERFRAFVTATSDVVYSMSPDWREMQFLVGKDFIADTTDPSRNWLERYILPADQLHVLAAIEEAIRTTSAFELEHRVIRVDGTVGWTLSRAMPIRSSDGGIVEWFGAARDITERKHCEQVIVDADRHRDELIAMLAHELRNPLAPMTNALELLHKANDKGLQEKARAILERQLAALRRLVDDLLEITRITSGRLLLRKEPMALGTTLERAAETARPLFESRRQVFSLTTATPIELEADAARLQQVFVNLFMNAAKYTDQGGRIDVSAWLERDHAVVSVKDTGIGIDAELLPRLFEPFTQAKRSMSRSEGGLGLGLAIASRLIGMHAGTIEAHSVVGEGSEFTVRIPLNASAD